MTQRRIYQTKYPYLITINVLEKRSLFRNTIAAMILRGHFRDWAREYRLNIFSYMLMPDHFHTLFHIHRNPKRLSDFIMYFKSTAALEIQRFAKFEPLLHEFSTGPIWQRRFNHRIIDSPERFKKALHYLKNNPTKKGLPKEYAQYPYYFVDWQKAKEFLQNW